MAEIKDKLRADLSAAMKERDTATTGVLRMALAAVGKEEVAGKQARELSDEEVLKVLSKEVKKRDESAEAFRGAGREEQAAAEEAEAEVLRRYLPQPLTDDELSRLVAEAIAEVEAELGEKPGMKQMGQVMKLANAKAAGRAEGGQVAGLVKAKLQG
ncbi:GatB/YqeY domain-containing protein [Saccharopolyspora griseoalba]|uniref:GatB/YqeY domain-containing protein n=1 Tax=Saccharopolyspora griseoalba TaxID=1431848 RepID=A0ABW2LL41_9PSEU